MFFLIPLAASALTITLGSASITATAAEITAIGAATATIIKAAKSKGDDKKKE